MPTEVIKEIRPLGGGDYTSLDSWNTSEAKDLVAADEIAVAEVYGGGSAVSGANLFPGSGFTTDATRFIHIRAAAGEQHQGVWDTNKAHASITASNYVMIFNSRHTRMTGMQLENTGTNSGVVLQTQPNGTTMEITNCFLRLPSSATFATVNRRVHVQSGAFGAGSSIIFRNTIFINNCTPGGTNWQICSFANGSPVEYYNCAFICRQGGNFDRGIESMAASTIVKNCYAGNSAGWTAERAYNGTTSGVTTSATSDTQTGAAFTQNVTFSTANFISVTVDAENLQLQPSSVLNDTGTDISADGVTDDILGVARPQFAGYDIGPFENEVPICWNYTAPYKGSTRLFKASGPGAFPRKLNVPSNVDTSKGQMIDDGQLIDPDEYDIN